MRLSFKYSVTLSYPGSFRFFPSDGILDHGRYLGEHPLILLFQLFEDDTSEQEEFIFIARTSWFAHAVQTIETSHLFDLAGFSGGREQEHLIVVLLLELEQVLAQVSGE